MDKKDTLLIDFAITFKCNYRCPYCDQGIDKTDYQSADNEVCDSIIDFVKKYDKTIILQLVGGEPTIHPRFIDIVTTIAKSGNYFQTCTNFSKPIEYWEKLVEILQDKLCRLQVSYHPTQIKDKQEFIQKLLRFNEIKHKDTQFILASVLTETNYNDILDLQEKLKNSDIKLELQHERDTKGNFLEYNDKLKNLLQKSFHIEGMDKIQNNSSYGIECSAGKNFITIGPDGNIGRCYQAPNSYYCLGNITTKFKLYKHNIPCMCEKCYCNLPFTHGCLNFKNKNILFANLLNIMDKTKINNKIKELL